MNKTLNIKGKIIDLSTTQLMGILNVTPDSFYSKSRFSVTEVVEKSQQMIADGATFIDIGGYSTRPNATDISIEEELDRVLPVIEEIIKSNPSTIISIDTFRSEVAKQAIRSGASLVNDISGGNLDLKMFATIAELGVPYILMHSRGNPQTMSQLNDYQDITLDTIKEIQAKMYQLQQLNVKDIIIDPGFGFAKNAKQGFEMMANLEKFAILGVPLLIGISRKSMIWKTLGVKPEEALNGTTVLNTIALQKGASILRVHDVKEAAETVKIWSEVKHFM
ncbi:MAG: dihydropteroate synthase [Spirosomaceae bacterium]|nr:dihydropteroate synthase [Spirosomataceae bacterium]